MHFRIPPGALTATVIALYSAIGVPSAMGYAIELPPQATRISEHKLGLLAAALAQIQVIKEEYEDLLPFLNPVDRAEFVNVAKMAIEDAVRNQGLSMVEFETLVNAALQDRKLRERLRARLVPTSE